MIEEFLNAASGGAIWGIGFGVGMGLLGAANGGARSLTKGALRGAMAVGDWMRSATEESRETLQDVYHEAKAEREESIDSNSVS